MITSGDEPLSGRRCGVTLNAGAQTVRMWMDALPAELVMATDASLVGRRGGGWPSTRAGSGGRRSARRRPSIRLRRYPPDGAARAAVGLQGRGRGRGAARRRESTPSADDPFIATVQRLVQGISWTWLGDTGRAGNFWWKRPAGPKLRQPAGVHLRRGVPGAAGGEPGDPALADSLWPTRSRRWARRSATRIRAMFPALARRPAGNRARGLGRGAARGRGGGRTRPPRRRRGGTRRGPAHRGEGQPDLPGPAGPASIRGGW